MSALPRRAAVAKARGGRARTTSGRQCARSESFARLPTHRTFAAAQKFYHPVGTARALHIILYDAATDERRWPGGRVVVVVVVGDKSFETVFHRANRPSAAAARPPPDRRALLTAPARPSPHERADLTSARGHVFPGSLAHDATVFLFPKKLFAPPPPHSRHPCTVVYVVIVLQPARPAEHRRYIARRYHENNTHLFLEKLQFPRFRAERRSALFTRSFIVARSRFLFPIS